jgi:exopolysaccharide biosynthesis polyprenyl glycosylphosphotransferase
MAEQRVRAGISHTSLWRNQPEIVKPRLRSAANFLPFADFLAVAMLPFLGSLLRQTTENLQRNLCFWSLLALFTVMLIASHGGYRAPGPIGPRKQTGLAINCFLAISIAMLSMALLLGHPHIIVRRWTLADIAVTPFLIGCVRTTLAYRPAREVPGPPAGGPLVVCYDHCPDDLAFALREQQIFSRISGVLYLSPARRTDERPNWPVLPDIGALLDALQRHNAQDVVFVHHPALDRLATTEHQELLAELLVYPARIWLAFDIAGKLPDLLKDRSGTCKIVPIVSDDLVSSLNLTKRVFDVVCSLVILILAAPLLLAAACLVKASSPGPIIFRQTRIGAHGHRFTVLKFRTMANDASRSFAQARQADPRITKIGRFLRRTSLDELLQLFNVLTGDMSLVGPRPHAPETEVEGINFENAVRLYRLRHRVKPGITGLAQIRGQRGETRAISMLEQRLASDLEYIQSWSLWLDISIMFQTLPVLIAQTNAW